MGREEQIINERLRKLEEMQKKGIQPYAYRFEKKNKTSDIQEKYKNLAEDQRTNDFVKTAGRVMIIRDLGNLIFATLQDSFGKIQIVLQNKETPDAMFKFFKKFVDAGDIIGVEGKVFKTKRGEVSILLSNAEMLAKSILPLPEKWHGIQDEEERLRKRYLDLTINVDKRKIFEIRGKMIEAMRNFMRRNGFVEVETPLLQAVYGGAAAKPFKTHCDAFDSDLFLSIAPELYLKKALVAGYEKVYEITKKFRNEGVDRQHNPEHMTIEWYQAYADYEDGMRLFEDLVKDIAMKLFGKFEIEYQGEKIDLTNWRKIPLLDAIKEYLKEDITKVKTDEQAKKIAKKHGIDPNKVTKGNLADELMKLFRNKLIQPTFLIDYPIELAPLARPKRGDPTKAEIFQPFIGGMELARAYSELNEPLLQEKHFDEQEKEREKGNEEAMPTDRDFINALKHGMPPACGVGIGIERLAMLFTNSNSIREVIMFPFIKPEKKEIESEEKPEENKSNEKTAAKPGKIKLRKKKK